MAALGLFGWVRPPSSFSFIFIKTKGEILVDVQTLKRGISRNSSAILTIAGAVGVIATAVSAAKDTVEGV